MIKSNLSKYNYGFEQLSSPFWQSDIIYNESVLFAENESGNIVGSLAFEAVKILSVRDYTLKKEFKLGVDYELKEGKILFLKDSNMPYFTRALMRGEGIYRNPEIRNVRIGEDPLNNLFTSNYEIFTSQVFVTYIYEPSKYVIPKAEYQGDKLLSLDRFLKVGGNLNVLILGDSISGGGQSSTEGNIEPFCPNWVDIFGSAIQNQLPQNISGKVNVVNKSVGGQISEFSFVNQVEGTTYCEYYTKQTEPDIVMLAYGMNDGTLRIDADKYKDNLIKTMQLCMSASNKELDFIIIGTMMPNDNGGGWLFPDGVGGNAAYGLQNTYHNKIKDLPQIFDRTIYVNMWEIHKYLLQNKKYEDMTVNNLNHPNDFLIRVHAMNLIEATLKDTRSSF